jgi:integration host factor subunit alpha
MWVLDLRESRDMVNQFFNEIKDTLKRSEPVKLLEFGKFILRDRVSRPGRNPKTGVETLIPARRM